jgi:guanosine-3',5'-bis(diphosphate) 3'-pyrophosphohydrolase
MKQTLNVEFEKAIRILAEYMPLSDESTRKPVFFHDLRVGVYLYEQGYSRDIVLAGVLHDAIEDSEITAELIAKQFGVNVAKLVSASTKDSSIKDSKQRIDELILRCSQNGEDALIVKAADILDSFKYYTSVNNKAEIEYCLKNAEAIFKYKPKEYQDKVFDELANWQTF